MIPPPPSRRLSRRAPPPPPPPPIYHPDLSEADRLYAAFVFGGWPAVSRQEADRVVRAECAHIGWPNVSAAAIWCLEREIASARHDILENHPISSSSCSR